MPTGRPTSKASPTKGRLIITSSLFSRAGGPSGSSGSPAHLRAVADAKIRAHADLLLREIRRMKAIMRELAR